MVGWIIDYGSAKSTMGITVPSALNSVLYTVLAVVVVYVVSVLIASFLLNESILLSACVNAGLILLWVAVFVFISLNKKEGH